MKDICDGMKRNIMCYKELICKRIQNAAIPCESFLFGRRRKDFLKTIARHIINVSSKYSVNFVF